MSLGRLALFLVIICGMIVSCASGSGQTPEDNPQAGASAKKVDVYRIGVDDTLQVSVWRTPDLSVAVPVRPDGKISVPLVGDIQAGGLTPEEVAAAIKQKLSQYVRDPNVIVILTGLRSHEYLSRIRITGAVRAPRSLPYRDGMTVLDVVLEAGGPTDFAAPNRTKLYRKEKTGMKVIEVRLDSILNKGDLDTNEELLPGDVITVPERWF